MPAYEAVLAGRRVHEDAESPLLRETMAQLATGYLAADNASAAEPLLRELLALRERLEPEAWTTFNTQAMLGGALLQLDRAGEAEPWLVSGYEGMLARRGVDTVALDLRLTQTLERLVQVYEQLDRPEDLAVWRAKQAAFLAAPTP